MQTKPPDISPERDNEEPDQATARTLGCHNFLDGCTGALLGLIIFPALALKWLLADAGTSPYTGEAGPLTMPILLIVAAVVGIAVGALAGKTMGAIVSRKSLRSKQSEGRTAKDQDG